MREACMALKQDMGLATVLQKSASVKKMKQRVSKKFMDVMFKTYM